MPFWPKFKSFFPKRIIMAGKNCCSKLIRKGCFRPIAAFHHHLKMLRCGPSERPFAATAKSARGELTDCGQCRPLQLRLSLAQHFLAGAASRLLQCTIAVIKIRSRVSNPNNAFGASGSNNLVTQQAALIVLLICHAGYSSYARYFLVKATVAHLMDEYRLVI
jgi:hypothetical protein